MVRLDWSDVMRVREEAEGDEICDLRLGTFLSHSYHFPMQMLRWLWLI